MRNLVTTDMDCRKRNTGLIVVSDDVVEDNLDEPVCRRKGHVDCVVPIILH